MEFITNAINVFFTFKAYVMLPVILLLLALLIRMELKQALLLTLQLATGFAGIFIAFEFFVENIGPAVESLMQQRGLDYPVLDVGWPPLAAITWASPVAHLSIPLVILINIIMLATNACRTIYLDIWNYWHFALVGALVLATNESLTMALLATSLIAIYTIKLSDWTAPEVEKAVGRKGLAVAPLSSTGLLPYAVGVNWLFERIPFAKTLDFNPQKRQGSLSLLAEPMVIGFVVGLVLGWAAVYNLKDTLELAVHISAVMFILPKCGALIGQGLEPVSIKLRDVIKQKFPSKANLNVAMDTGFLMEHKSIIVTGIILMPISLGLALILPGNKTLPLGDLPSLISQVTVIVLIMRGNVIRSVAAGIPLVIAYLLIASKLAPMFTELSLEVGVSLGTDAQITAFTDGGNPVRYWFLELFAGNFVAFCIIPVVGILFWLSWKRYSLTQRTNEDSVLEDAA